MRQNQGFWLRNTAEQHRHIQRQRQVDFILKPAFHNNSIKWTVIVKKVSS